MKIKIVFALSIFTLFFTGCHYGIKGHQVFSKEGTPQVETISQVIKKLGYDDSYYLDLNSSQYDVKNIRDCGYSISYNTLGQDKKDESIQNLTNDSKVIVQYFHKEGLMCGGSPIGAPVLVGQCSQKMPTEKDVVSDSYFEALAIHGNSSASNLPKNVSYNTAVILIPSKLKSKNLLDGHNFSKGDICIYPLSNMDCGTLKKGDWFTIPKKEMDKALTEFYDEQNNQ